MSNQPMTAFAQAALAVSDLVAAKFSGTKFGGSLPRIVKVQAPNVPSTGGGKQARESVILLPENGDTAQAVTAGFIDVGLRSVELRTFNALNATYMQRHGRPLDIPRDQYDAFVAELQGFLGGEGYIVKMHDVSDQEAKAQKAQKAEDNAVAGSGGVPMGGIIALVGIIVVGIVAAIVLLR